MLGVFDDEKINATLITVAVGSYTKGIYSPGAESTETIRVIAPQPITPNEKQLLPSGELERNYLKTWTDSEITGWGAANPDKLQISGKTYKVMMIENRSTLGNFYKLTIYEEKSNE